MTDPELRAAEERLFTIARTRFGYRGTPQACLGPGYALPRRFLDRHAAIDVPESGHDETRLPLFAQIFGVPLADTDFYPTWFDARGERLFNATDDEITVGAVEAELRRPGGRRAFHPCREAFGARELEDLAQVSSTLRQSR